MSPLERAIQDAAEAHTNLTVFASVVSLMEGGHLYGGASTAAATRVIRICQAEQQKLLRRYDAAVAKASKP